jgi:hypothetical protein
MSPIRFSVKQWAQPALSALLFRGVQVPGIEKADQTQAMDGAFFSFAGKRVESWPGDRDQR